TIINEASDSSDIVAGSAVFFDTSTAGYAIIVNKPGTGNFPGEGAATYFVDNSSAGSATVRNLGGGAFYAGTTTQFSETSTAGGAFLQFEERTTGGKATLIAYGSLGGAAGGSIHLLANSTGENARVELFDNGNLDISVHNSLQTAIGSLAGNGLVLLGEHSLSIGNNDISTTFSGVIQDTGSVFKVGTGTLTLGGSSTYTGGT